MGYVYRYTDLEDGVIKYVGIVWSNDRTLSQRINEHFKNDSWCQDKKWKIEYIHEDINTRTDAEYFEAHYISLYGTEKYFNKKKLGWGISSFLPNREKDWLNYEHYNQDNILKTTKSNYATSEATMAQLLTNHLFMLKNDDEILSFGRKLRSKTNKNYFKNEENYKYWSSVLDLLDAEVGKRLFGEDKVDNSFLDVYVNGCGQIVIHTKGLGNIIYRPYEDSYEIMKDTVKEIISKEELLQYLGSYIVNLTKVKNLFVST